MEVSFYRILEMPSFICGVVLCKISMGDILICYCKNRHEMNILILFDLIDLIVNNSVMHFFLYF